MEDQRKTLRSGILGALFALSNGYLDMQSGTLLREVIWQTASGPLLSIKSERLVSFEHRHLAVISDEATVWKAHVPVVITSEIADHKTICECDGGPRHPRLFKEKVLKPECQRQLQKSVENSLSHIEGLTTLIPNPFNLSNKNIQADGGIFLEVQGIHFNTIECVMKLVLSAVIIFTCKDSRGNRKKVR